MRKRLLGLLVVLSVAAGGSVVPSEQSSAATPRIQAVKARRAMSLVNTVGVNLHLAYPDTAYKHTSAVRDALVRLGVRHVRDHMYVWNPSFFEAVRMLAKSGIRFDMIMGDWPWNTPTPAALVRSISSNLPPGAVESLEGVNEWDLTGLSSWPADLRTNQSALFAAARDDPATKDLPVLAPSLAFSGSYGLLGDLSGVADMGNSHVYPGGLPPSAKITQFIQLAASVVPDRPVVVTESGFHNALETKSTHPPTSESAAGIYAPTMLLEHFARGTRRLYFYELLDERSDPGLLDKEQHFGLLRNDFTPKPAYRSLRRTLRLVVDPGPSFSPGSLRYEVRSESDVRQLLLQKRGGTFVLFLWRDVAVWDPFSEVRLRVPSETVVVRLARPKTIGRYRPTRSGGVADRWVGETRVPVTLKGGVVALTIR